MHRATIILALLLCACAGLAGGTDQNKAVRFERTANGHHTYLIILPEKGVYCEVQWCLVAPLSEGSNFEAPYAFARRLDSSECRQELERNWHDAARDTLSIPERCAHEIERLAARADEEVGDKEQCAELLFRAGLLPRLWNLDLESIGQDR